MTIALTSKLMKSLKEKGTYNIIDILTLSPPEIFIRKLKLLSLMRGRSERIISCSFAGLQKEPAKIKTLPLTVTM